MTRLMRDLFAAVALIAASIGSLSAQDTVQVVVVATTDIHGRVYHWDYVRDAEAPWGLTRAATIVDSLRQAYPGRVLVVDAGDLIQGSPFATYFATQRPASPHLVMDALNAVGYDVATPGNHDFDFGLEVFALATASAAFPFVSGNVFRLPRDTLVFPGYAVVHRGVRVGVTGFTTPGTMVWNRGRLADRVMVRRIVPQAEGVLRDMDSAGVDLRVVVMHSGMGEPSSYDTTGVGAENVAPYLTALPVKPHLVVVGHTHRTVKDVTIEGVHFMQPPPWARGLALAHVWLVQRDGRYRVVRIEGERIPLAGVPPHPVVTRRLEQRHASVRNWVNLPLATVEGEWSARFARAQDTPIIDFINEVQRHRIDADLSATAAFDPAARFGPNEVRLRDVAGVYPYENTLMAVRIDGSALGAYLERSAAYFRTFRPGEPIINETIPSYDFDMVSGVEYVIDLTRPVGQRVRQLTYQGELVQPSDTFTLALNSYRQRGGGGFEMLAGLPVVYDRGEDIRDLIVEFLRSVTVVRSDEYFTPSWQIIPPEAAEAVRAAVARQGRR